MKIFIIGHNNPDADSIISSIILSDFLKKIKLPYFNNFIFEPKRSGQINKETKFILNYFKEKEPSLVKNVKNKKVFLVDHGGYEESAPGITEAELIGVLDHHKINGLKTTLPIFYRAEPVGATCTILAKMFFENNLDLNKKQAGLLLAGILSDTLNLTSPTTTFDDKKIVKKLINISKENSQKLGQKILEIKSDISDISVQELIKRDYKEFESGGLNYGIGVLETLNIKKAKEKDISLVLEKLKKEKKVNLIFFAFIDILKNNTELFLLSEQERITAEKVFKKKAEGNYLFLPGISSRKKQILPPFVKFLEKNV